MERVRVQTSTLRPTNNSLLDLNRVQRFLDMLRQGGGIMPITLVEDSPGLRYILRGHHEAYAAEIFSGEADANMLKTDIDVMSCTLGRARKFSTIKDLVEDCERGNRGGMEAFGIEMAADYKRYQPLHYQVKSAAQVSR